MSEFNLSILPILVLLWIARFMIKEFFCIFVLPVTWKSFAEKNGLTFQPPPRTTPPYDYDHLRVTGPIDGKPFALILRCSSMSKGHRPTPYRLKAMEFRYQVPLKIPHGIKIITKGRFGLGLNRFHWDYWEKDRIRSGNSEFDQRFISLGKKHQEEALGRALNDEVREVLRQRLSPGLEYHGFGECFFVRKSFPVATAGGLERLLSRVRGIGRNA